MKTPVDFRGKPLEVGTRVAFNLSGGVAIGAIDSVDPIKHSNPNHLKWWPKDTHSFKVRVLEAESQKPGHISKVRSYHNLISLEGE